MISPTVCTGQPQSIADWVFHPNPDCQREWRILFSSCVCSTTALTALWGVGGAVTGSERAQEGAPSRWLCPYFKALQPHSQLFEALRISSGLRLEL